MKKRTRETKQCNLTSQVKKTKQKEERYKNTNKISDVRIMKKIIIQIYNILQVLWSSKVKFVSLSQLLGCPLFGSNTGPFTVPGLTVSHLFFQCPQYFLVSYLHKRWDAVGCLLCSSVDWLGISPMCRRKWTLLPPITAIFPPYKTHFRCQDINKLKVKGLKNIFHANGKHTRAALYEKLIV